jgi:RimJ/RimL family protein N-acetyltransferase
MEFSPTLIGPNLILRQPRESDKADRRNCIRSREEYRMYGIDFEKMDANSGENTDAWFVKYLVQPFHWSISCENRCIGTARLSRIDWDKKCARFSIGIFDSSLWNKGLGTEATALVLKYAFGTAGLSRVELMVLECNARAIACYLKCGFLKEGVIPGSVLLENKWHDDIVMGISKEAYQKWVASEASGDRRRRD